MITTEHTTKRSIYETPELKVMAFELGVFGNYGNADDPGSKPGPNLGFGTTAE